MESPNNGGDKASAREPSETTSARNGLTLIKFLAKGGPWNPQITQATSKAMGCFPPMDGRVLLPETTLTYLIEQGEIKLVPA